ncbi:MAG: hypothetical protein A4E42_01771 [Methanoregulaceae archaeon PtaU1.Bin222]|nr:MAG: hypothetical protein A4E42_01771 [Methanoregulaceae archaeon PtaU1.Bin222]
MFDKYAVFLLALPEGFFLGLELVVLLPEFLFGGRKIRICGVKVIGFLEEFFLNSFQFGNLGSHGQDRRLVIDSDRDCGERGVDAAAPLAGQGNRHVVNSS